MSITENVSRERARSMLKRGYVDRPDGTERRLTFAEAAELRRIATTVPLPPRVQQMQAINAAAGNAALLLQDLQRRVGQPLEQFSVTVQSTSANLIQADAVLAGALEQLDRIAAVRQAIEDGRKVAQALAKELAAEERAKAEAEAERRRQAELEAKVAAGVAAVEAERLAAVEEQVRAELAGSAR